PLLAAFTLEPEGTVFDAPVTVNFAVSLDGTNWPEVFLVSGGAVASLPATVVLDSVTGQATVSIEVPHFSTVVALNGDWTTSITNPGDQPMNEPFTVVVTVANNRSSSVVPSYQADNSFGEAILDAFDFHDRFRDPSWGLEVGSFTGAPNLVPQ